MKQANSIGQIGVLKKWLSFLRRNLVIKKNSLSSKMIADMLIIDLSYLLQRSHF